MSENTPKSPLLSILIPVYNGEKYINHLLGMFSRYFGCKRYWSDQVEIVVANNLSDDNTEQVVRSFSSVLPMMRAVLAKSHVPTAEENVFRSFSLCRGTYTWTLGVDDIPNFDCLDRVMQLLQKKEHDFYLFNFSTVSREMRLARSHNLLMRSDIIPVQIAHLAQRFGFWYVLAGMSGQIVRTEVVKAFDFQRLLQETSVIYSHVAAYLNCFKNKSVVVVNECLVFYHVSYLDIAHWRRAARKMNVFDEYFWTLGYIRQLKYMILNQIVPVDFLHFMLETNEYRFFRPVHVVGDKLYSQVATMRASTEKRNQLSERDFLEIYDFLILEEPFLRESLWKIKALFYKVLEGKPTHEDEWNEANNSLQAVITDFPLAALSSGIHGDYDLFHVANRYYGVLRGVHNLLLERLRYIEGEEQAPEVFAADSLDRLKARIDEYYLETANKAPEQDFRYLIRQMQRHLEATDGRLTEVKASYAEVKASYSSVLNSKSHRLTAPLRSVLRTLRRILGLS